MSTRCLCELKKLCLYLCTCSQPYIEHEIYCAQSNTQHCNDNSFSYCSQFCLNLSVSACPMTEEKLIKKNSSCVYNLIFLNKITVIVFYCFKFCICSEGNAVIFVLDMLSLFILLLCYQYTILFPLCIAHIETFLSNCIKFLLKFICL